MAAPYGALFKPRAKDIMEHCKTKFAASIRPFGMFIFWFRNHTPTISIKMTMTIDIQNWAIIEVEKTSLSFSLSLRPISNVKKRLIELERDEEAIENIATKPPTTLFIP